MAASNMAHNLKRYKWVIILWVVSNLLVLLAHFYPGPLTLTGVLLPINLVCLIVLLFNLRHKEVPTEIPPVEPGPSMAIWPLVTLLMLIVFFRFVSLGYSEYQGDEAQVITLADSMIAGQDDATFLHSKGPVELVVAAYFALLSGNFNEFSVRFPFALASGWAIWGTYVLGRHLLGQEWGWLAAVLLAVNWPIMYLLLAMLNPTKTSRVTPIGALC